MSFWEKSREPRYVIAVMAAFFGTFITLAVLLHVIDQWSDTHTFEECRRICGDVGVASASDNSCNCREKIKVIN